jgi:hypothetical protein
MATPTRDKWILFGVVVATFAILAYLDSIVLVYVLYLIGGIVLLFVPFRSRRIRSRWAKSLLVASALLLILKGAVELLTHLRVWTPSAVMQRGLPHTLAMVDGVVLGFLLSLAFSGQLAGQKPVESKPFA